MQEQQGDMADHPIKSFWGELRRRKVVRVSVVYAIAAWAAVEVSSVVFPSLLLPDWTTRLVVALALIGFPVAVGLAWAFQVTPEGVKPEVQPRPEPRPVSRPSSPEPTTEERLDGWKRIAAHLNRDVRTLRRWENSEGLPVRRLMHDKQATVYAYRSELDAWLAQRGAEAKAPARAGRPRPHGKPGLRWVWAALPVLVLGALVTWFWPKPGAPAIAFGEWDWVLITDFDNRTGEAVLDGTVEYALRRELANSQFVKVAPPERINDTLRLMQQPADTPIDLAKGREISLRDGGIKMLVAGRVEKLGTTYVISAELVNPSDGVTLASFSAEAAGQDQILPRIGDLAFEVRAALGESLASIAESEEMLARVTTPSIEALRLYSKADAIFAGAERKHALPFLEEAVRIDSDFASAHNLLSYAYFDRDDPQRAVQHLQRAVELADHASERERLFILTGYYSYLQDEAKSRETSNLLLRLYPDHFWALGNLAGDYEYDGRFDQAYPLRRRAADLRPNLGYVHWDVAALAIANGQFEVAERHRDIGLNLAEADPFNAWLRGNFQMLPAYDSWVNGRYDEALEFVERLVGALGPEQLVADGWLYAHVRSLYLALGRLDRFRELSGWRPALGWFQALLDFEAGDPSTLDAYLEGQDAGFWTAALLARATQTERALEAIENPESIDQVPPPFFMRAWRNLARGELAFAEGRFLDAIELLGNPGLQHRLQRTHEHAFMFALHTLAEAHAAVGEVEPAIEALERARLQKPITIFDPGAAFLWQRNQTYLYQLYHDAGRAAAADEVAAELRGMLQLAGPDHPFLAALDQGSE